MRMSLYSIFLACAAAVSCACAWAQPQQGDHWSREPVTSALLQSSNDPVLKQLYTSTVRVNGATGTYLGIYAGLPVLMTAHHVMPTQDACTGQVVSFYGPSLAFTCQRLLGAWADVDVSLFILSANAGAALAGRGLKPGFDAHISQFEELETMGHGSEQNPGNLLTVDRGPDCYVASASDDFRFRDNTTWSMALGCNESAGDSGSPIIDRTSGLLLGIVWGGHTDKDDDIANSAYLRSLAQANAPDLWVQLNYASPMPVVGAMFRYLLKTQNLDTDTAAVLSALVQ